jgi:hypothetical protein
MSSLEPRKMTKMSKLCTYRFSKLILRVTFIITYYHHRLLLLSWDYCYPVNSPVSNTGDITDRVSGIQSLWWSNLIVCYKDIGLTFTSVMKLHSTGAISRAQECQLSYVRAMGQSESFQKESQVNQSMNWVCCNATFFRKPFLTNHLN